MSTTCATCRAEVGDAAFCPQCGRAVLSPQSVEPSPPRRRDERRSDTAERPAVRGPVEPAPAASTPGPVRFPLYADELDVAGHSEPPGEQAGYHAPPAAQPLPPAYEIADVDDDDARRGGPATWLPWLIVAVVMILVAVSGIWLLLSPGGDDSVSDAPASSQSTPRDSGTPTSDEPAPTSQEPASETSSPTTPAGSGDAADVASSATATAPRAAPPNADAFGNRTTYVAANMLDGRPDTCWRMAGDGTGVELVFRLAAPTALSRVGLINGYAKNAVVAGRNLNWYIGNRRVLSVQWVFDDGTTVDQPLVATKQMQTIDLGEPVTTSVVRLHLVAVSSPGTGRSARDYTAVSEVTLVGTPAG